MFILLGLIYFLHKILFYQLCFAAGRNGIFVCPYYWKSAAFMKDARVGVEVIEVNVVLCHFKDGKCILKNGIYG